MAAQPNLFETGEAVFSKDREYRYLLRRRWAEGPYVCYVLLNPSTADAIANDPTVERCERRAYNAGWGGMEVVNLFAIRATDPKEMLKVSDPVGPLNDSHILESARGAGLVIAGWGTHGKHLNRAAEVAALLQHLEVACLGTTRGGEPKHPLYISYEQEAVPLWAPTKESGG